MKEITIYCYNRCTTCKKAEKYLEEKATKNKNIVIIKKDIITELSNLQELSSKKVSVTMQTKKARR